MPALLVASTNPVKIAAATRGFEMLFGAPDLVRSVASPSGVPEQPFGDDDTLLGAENRAAFAAAGATADAITIAIEGGVAEGPGALFAFAWVVARDRKRLGRARSAAFALPLEVAQLVRAGVELGHADDQVFGRSMSKHQDGAIGILSGGAIDRLGLYAPAVVMALLPWKRPDLSWSA